MDRCSVNSQLWNEWTPSQWNYLPQRRRKGRRKAQGFLYHNLFNPSISCRFVCMFPLFFWVTWFFLPQIIASSLITIISIWSSGFVTVGNFTVILTTNIMSTTCQLGKTGTYLLKPIKKYFAIKNLQLKINNNLFLKSSSF